LVDHPRHCCIAGEVDPCRGRLELGLSVHQDEKATTTSEIQGRL
jgi:hypothetical protein